MSAIFFKNTSILDKYLVDCKYSNNKKEVELVLLGSKPINLDEFPKLKGIFRVGVGLDNVPIEAAKKRNIKIQITSNNTNNIIFEETANFTCFLILKMLYSDLGNIENWKINIRKNAFHNKKLLIIGKGNIGKRVEKKMSQLMNVNTFDILEENPDKIFSKIPIADCISIHIPLTTENIHYFDKEKLALMKNGSVLVNTSRASIVSEEALYNEIKTNRIKSAFDVFWTKPYKGKLKNFHPNNFFMTPHIASKCKEYIESAAYDFKQFIKDFN